MMRLDSFFSCFASHFATSRSYAFQVSRSSSRKRVCSEASGIQFGSKHTKAGSVGPKGCLRATRRTLNSWLCRHAASEISYTKQTCESAHVYRSHTRVIVQQATVLAEIRSLHLNASRAVPEQLQTSSCSLYVPSDEHGFQDLLSNDRPLASQRSQSLALCRISFA